MYKRQKKYNHWIDNIYEGEVMTVDIDHEDFVMNPAVIDRVVARIEELRALRGKQPNE